MNKKGFTLIELLAVIVILSVVALITSVVVLNLIDDAHMNTFESSVQGVYRTIESDYLMNNFDDHQTYEIKDNKIINTTYSENKYEVEFNGTIDHAKGTAVATYNEEKGVLEINIEVQNNTYCARSIDSKNKYNIIKGKC